jgi:hypothetical protein
VAYNIRYHKIVNNLIDTCIVARRKSLRGANNHLLNNFRRLFFYFHNVSLDYWCYWRFIAVFTKARNCSPPLVSSVQLTYSDLSLYRSSGWNQTRNHFKYNPKFYPLDLTEQVGLSGKVSNLSLGGVRFKSRPEQQLARLRISWFSSAPPGKFRDSALNYSTTAPFHILSNSLSSNHSMITDSVLNKLKTNSIHLIKKNVEYENNCRIYFASAH